MKGGKFFLYALLIAIWAGIITLITWNMNGVLVTCVNSPLTYVVFLAWASYFLIGANVKSALIAFGSSVVAVIAGALMFILSIAFGFTPWWAVPLGVIIVVLPVMYSEKWKPISNVGYIFLAIGMYFSLSAAGVFNGEFTLANYAIVALAELMYIVIGFIAGWVSIKIFGFCAGLGAKKDSGQSPSA